MTRRFIDLGGSRDPVAEATRRKLPKGGAVALPAMYDALTQQERRTVRNIYVARQMGACYYCSCNLNQQPSDQVIAMPLDETRFPDGFFRHPVHLHHDHNTGLTIGAVHARCNAVLWQYHGE